MSIDPDLLDFFGDLLGYYFAADPRQHPAVMARMEQARDRLTPAVYQDELDKFRAAGLLRGKGLSGDSQVQLFWSSPLTDLYRHAIGYQPEPGDDVRTAFPAPVRDARELAERQREMSARVRDGCLARGETQYWRLVFLLGAHELYLAPFLRPGMRGLDLGCGWGRASLPLSHPMVCLDRREADLALLEGLAATMERTGLETVAGDVCQLPFTADAFDFAVSFFLLDLLSGKALDRCLREVLRVLRLGAPFHVQVPAGSFCANMMLQRFTTDGFIDRLQAVEAHGKTFQVAIHEGYCFTFAVLPADFCGRRGRTGKQRLREQARACKGLSA